MSADPAVTAALERLASLHPKLIDLSLGRMEAVLDALGNPHGRLPPVIHVAGTNGKGSTVALLRAILEAAGFSVHVYTSPHLVRPNERIRLAGKLIEDAAFVSVLERVESAARETGITQFEAWTAAAFFAFSETPADILLLEVGLGGRLDATNVVPSPTVCVITPVDLDHQDFLGSTLAAIAAEKAGILKPGAAVVVGRQSEEAAQVIDARLAELGLSAQRFGVEWDAYPKAGRMVLQTEDALFDLPMPALLGSHQVENAGTAIMAAMALEDPRITHEAMVSGLRSAQWPARFQPLQNGPLAERAISSGAELWLDGGHNPHGARAIAATLAQRNAAAPMPLVVIVGMLGTKDSQGFFEALKPLSPRIISVPVRSSAAGRDPEELATTARQVGLEAIASNSVLSALDLALASPTPPRILIAGSLYLAGEVLALGPALT